MLQKLIRFLPIAEKVIARKTTLPILSHICVKDGYISATDLENTVRMKVDDTRSYTIPLVILKTVLMAKPQFLEIDILGDKKVQIKYGPRKLTFNSLDPGEFPTAPLARFKSLGQWSREIIRKLHDQLPYTFNKDLKPALTGVYVDQSATLKSCATDGHILRLINDANEDRKGKLKNDFKGIIPKKALQILSHTVKRDVHAAATNTHLRIMLDKDTEFIARLINEKYPDFDSVIPKEFKGSVSLNKSSFEGLVRDAKPFVNRETGQAAFTIGKSSVEIEVEDKEKDISWDSSMPVMTRDGEEIQIGLNVHLLGTVLKGINETEVLWQYISPAAANIFTGINGQKPNTLHLIMPIRLKGDNHE